MKFILVDSVLYTTVVFFGGTCGEMVIAVGNGHGNLSSILGKALCISHSAHAFRKCMHPSILPPAMDKKSGRLSSIILVWQLVKNENSEFKRVKLHLKNWPCVTFCLCGGVR